MNNSDRIKSVVAENRVKAHIFEPSMRVIWTVVGNSEHWIDPDGHYCSCAGYYFGTASGKKSCYHLDSAMLAIKQDRIEIVRFSDDEFGDFISGLISEL
ncbi:MAG: hypothetical protein OXC46_02540 [Thaumarchaeota archaeon]|nr:hypothetical protein [Nitrososphaerota archaeon]